jgi:phage baseplate assembly protein W
MPGLNKNSGKNISDEDAHIRQSIGDILTTPLGSRVMRRTYGSALPDLIDAPLNQKTTLRLYAATAAAIMRWEPRFKISNIALFIDGAGAVVEVTGSTGNVPTLITEVPITPPPVPDEYQGSFMEAITGNILDDGLIYANQPLFSNAVGFITGGSQA